MIRLAAVFAATALVGACAAPADTATPGTAATTITNCGRAVTFERPPSRVVTLEQSSTETLLALGLGDRMVGTAFRSGKILPEYQAAYDKVPVLSPKQLTGEQLRAANPDLVVSSFASNFTKERVGTRDELQELGLASYISAAECHREESGTPFERLFRDYENYGRIFGVADRANALVAQQRQTLANATLVSGKPTVVYVYSALNGMPYVAGHNGIPSDISRIIGAPNAFDDITDEWPEVPWEEVARRDPTAFVIGDLADRGAPGDSAAEKIKLMREHPVISQLTAVRENRFIQVPGIELDPTVRSTNSLRLISEGLKSLGVAH